MKQMRLRFRLLVFLLIAMLASASIYGVYSVQKYGSRWVNSGRNARYSKARSTFLTGDIYDRNGVLLAWSDMQGNRHYQSDLLSRASVVHLLGDTKGYVSNGVESFQSSYLLGFHTNFQERLAALVSGKKLKGDGLILSVDSVLSTKIVSYFRNTENTKGKCGAVVVMNYKTGEVIALVSLPVYDPQNITEEIKNSSQSPFWNRATQSTLPPGSTFKIITTACALENIPDAEERIFSCNGALQVGENTITDFGNGVHNDLNLKKAFMQSCNNTFAQLALELGDAKLKATAESFGLNDNFIFQDFVVENSTYPTKNRTEFELAWSGVGQSRILVSPMHMCLIASAVANNGVMMEPRLLMKAVSEGGEVHYTISSKVYRQACAPQIAHTLKEYMKSTVESGTGTKAKVSGVRVCGKTGSAESSSNGQYVTHAWFAGFIDSDSYPYACCVLVENGGSGGSVAAPVAQMVFDYLVHGNQ